MPRFAPSMHQAAQQCSSLGAAAWSSVVIGDDTKRSESFNTCVVQHKKTHAWPCDPPSCTCMARAYAAETPRSHNQAFRKQRNTNIITVNVERQSLDLMYAPVAL